MDTKKLTNICDNIILQTEEETEKLIQLYITQIKRQSESSISQIERSCALGFLRTYLLENFNNLFQVSLIQECKFENDLLKFNKGEF